MRHVCVRFMNPLARFREHLLVRPILRYLDGDESIHAWTHANTPESRALGVLVVTNRHCLVHVASSSDHFGFLWVVELIQAAWPQGVARETAQEPPAVSPSALPLTCST
jgi:hypothetical protein